MNSKPLHSVFQNQKFVFLNLMRIAILLFFGTTFGFTPLKSLSQEVVHFKSNEKLTIDAIFEHIEAQTSYRFIYPSDLFKEFPEVNVKKGEVNVEKLLKNSFSSNPINFEIGAKNSILLSKTPKDMLVEQSIEVTGTVTDENGMPIPGVNITVEGTTQGTSTDFDGNYTVTAEEGEVLNFSSVGFGDKKVTVGQDTVINVILQESASALDEVVVTALGITREKRSLGYSTQAVESEDLTRVPTSNFTNLLSGKVSGLDIKRNNNFGGSTDVVIRGVSSLTGSSQALFVIDGVPISNRNTNTDTQKNGHGGYDFGNAAADIAPEDIESINVLKGAAAAALYGSRASNGVIEITTKKGSSRSGIGVTVSSGISVGLIDNSTWVKYQNEYGAGYSGNKFTHGESPIGDGSVTGLVVNYDDDASYGPKFDPSLELYQWDSFDPDSPNYLKKTPWVPAKHNTKEFFETPLIFTNSVSMGERIEDKGSYRFSYTNKKQNGLMPNSDMVGNDFRLNADFNLNDRLNVNGFANYINTRTKGRNTTGYGGAANGFRQWWQTNVDILDLKDIYMKTGRNVTWNPNSPLSGALRKFASNPYFSAYQNYQNDGRERLIGKFELNYKLTDWVNVLGRVTTDTYSEYQERRLAEGSGPSGFGVTGAAVPSGYEKTNITSYENNFDLMLNFNTDITEKLDFNGILGGNIRRNEFVSDYQSTAGGLINPGVYSLDNGKEPPPNPVQILEKIGVDAFYGSVSFGYDNTLFLDATLRNDHFSTLPKGHSKFWYPSISTGFVFSELLNSTFMDFGKIHLNYAEVGNGAPFDKIRDSYIIADDIGSTTPDSHNNPSLKPERTKSFETGLEMQFMKKRLSFDLTYYIANSINQIVQAPISPASGFHSKLLNAGKIRNQGVEFSVNAIPIETDDWKWSINANWSKNESKVVELPDGTSSLQLGDFQNGITIQATKGKAFGVINGTDYVYNENGERLVDENGRYLITSSSNQDIGNITPDWLMGISNTFSYKNLTFSFMIDVKKGGSIYSLDQAYGQASGILPNSVAKNVNGVSIREPIENGGGILNEGVREDGTPNDVFVDATENGELGYQGYPDSEFIYNASFVKLREVALNYSLPQRIIEHTFLNNVTFGVSGYNLWIIHKDLPMADPESGLGAGNLQGYSVASLPTTRNFSFKVTLQF